MQQKEDLGQKCNWQSNRVCRGGRKKNQAQAGGAAVLQQKKKV
jgi:hypothetical protein